MFSVPETSLARGESGGGGDVPCSRDARGGWYTSFSFLFWTTWCSNSGAAVDVPGGGARADENVETPRHFRRTVRTLVRVSDAIWRGGLKFKGANRGTRNL